MAAQKRSVDDFLSSLPRHLQSKIITEIPSCKHPELMNKTDITDLIDYALSVNKPVIKHLNGNVKDGRDLILFALEHVYTPTESEIKRMIGSLNKTSLCKILTHLRSHEEWI